MPPRVFSGYIARRIPEHHDPSWMPPHMHRYLLHRKQAEYITERLPGIPICGEHDEGIHIGKVLEAKVKANGDWAVRFQLNTDTQQAAEYAAAFVDLGYARSLSLQHDSVTNEPIEVTICQVPARAGSVIEDGMVALDNSKIPIYNHQWQRVRASARVRAHLPRAAAPSVVDARVTASAMSSSDGAGGHQSVAEQAAAIIHSAPGDIGGPMLAQMSAILDGHGPVGRTLAGGHTPARSAAAPAGSDGGGAPPAGPPATGPGSAAPALTPLTSPPAAGSGEPPSVGGGVAPSQPPAAAAADTGAGAPAGEAPHDAVAALVSATETVAGASIATSRDRAALINAGEAVVTELARTRRELEEARSTIAARDRDREQTAAYVQRQLAAWRNNQDNGMTPRGTAEQMRHDIASGAVDQARAVAAASASAAAPAPPPATIEPSVARRLEQFKALASAVLTSHVQPQRAGSSTPTRSAPAAAPASAPPAVTVAAAASAPAPAPMAYPWQLPEGMAAWYSHPPPLLTPYYGPGMMPGAPPGSGYVSASWPGPVAPPSRTGHVAAAAPPPPAPEAPMEYKRIPGEGSISDASGLPIGRMVWSEPVSTSTVHRTRVAASAYRARVDGSRMTASAEPEPFVDGSPFNPARVYAHAPDPREDRVAVCGWGNQARQLQNSVLSGGFEVPTSVEVPPPEYFPPRTRITASHPLYALLANGPTSVGTTITRDMLPDNIADVIKADREIARSLSTKRHMH